MNPYAMALVQRYEVSDPANPPLVAYLDKLATKPVWTIGYGSTGPDIVEGTTWTKAQCDERLAQDLQRAENDVRRAVHVALSEQSIGALVSLVYNAGPSSNATIFMLINAGKLWGAGSAAEEFEKWDHAAHREVLGLYIRRTDEKLTFVKGLR